MITFIVAHLIAYVIGGGCAGLVWHQVRPKPGEKKDVA